MIKEYSAGKVEAILNVIRTRFDVDDESTHRNTILFCAAILLRDQLILDFINDSRSKKDMIWLFNTVFDKDRTNPWVRANSVYRISHFVYEVVVRCIFSGFFIEAREFDREKRYAET